MFRPERTINRAEFHKLDSCVMLEAEKEQEIPFSLPSSLSKRMLLWFIFVRRVISRVVSAQHFSKLKAFSKLLLKQDYFLRMFLNKHQQKNLWYSMIIYICKADNKQLIIQNRDSPPSSLSLLHLNLIKLKWQERQGIIKVSKEKVPLLFLFFKESIKINQ